MPLLLRLCWLWVPLILLFPIIYSGNSVILGYEDGDAYKHLWGQWWVRHKIFSLFELPFHQDQLFYPVGGSFFCLDTLHALIFSPISFLGLPFAFNVAVLVQLMAAALGMKKMGEAIGVAPDSSWLASLLGLMCCWVFSFPIASGVSEHMGYCLTPWIGLALWRSFFDAEIRYPIYFVGLWITQALLCWSFAIITGLIVIAAVLFWLGRKPWVSGQEPWRFTSGVLRRMIITGILLVLPMTLFYMLIHSLSTGSDAVYQRGLSIFARHHPWENPQSNGFALIEFFQPLEGGLRTVRNGVETLRYSGYFGWLLLLLGGWSLVKGPRVSRICIVVAVAFAGLSLGPVIRFFPEGEGGINLWYTLLYYVVPLFNVLEHNVDRLVLPGFLLLVLGVTMAVSRLGELQKKTIAVLCFLEFVFLSPVPWPPPVAPVVAHPISKQIAAGPAGAVIDIPYTIPQSTQVIGDIFYQQTVHHQSIPYRLEGVGPNMVAPVVRDNAFFERIHNLSQNEGTSQDAMCSGSQELNQLGFQYVVLRKDSLKQSAALEQTLDKCLERISTVDERVLYQFSVP